jgi:hypothetical protein
VPVVGVQGLKVTGRLGAGQRAERIGFARDGQVWHHAINHKEKETSRWAPLVELAGGMQIPGPIAEGGGYVMARHETFSESRNGLLKWAGRSGVSQDGDVDAGFQMADQVCRRLGGAVVN